MQAFESSTMTELPPKPARFHFVGIGGISMSGLALILHDWGYQVSGSDQSASTVTELLKQAGITVQIGHEQAELASRADVLVVTPRAIPGAPNEIAAAVANGTDVVRRGQLLGMIANARVSIAVSGSHGKSSTSGMLTSALTTLDRDPSYSVGAMVGTTGRNSDSGTGPHMVVEADEFDRALLWLKPDVAIVTTISFDHPDCFTDQADYDRAFIDFAHLIRPGGVLITSADDPGCQRVLAHLASDETFTTRVVTFGQQEQADWTYRRKNGRWTVEGPDGISHPVNLQVPGAHNMANATAAIVAMVSQDIPVDEAIRGVESFSGVGRRFEHKGTVGGIDVIDDYGHHPDEIQATLMGTRDRYPDRRIVALFQPHTFSRTALLLDGFASSMDLADVPVLLDIYPAGEQNTWGVTSASISQRMASDAPVLPAPDDAVDWLATHTLPGDIVLTLGAGDVTVVGDRLLEALRKREHGMADTPARGVEHPSHASRSTARKKAETLPLPGTEVMIQRDVDMSLHTTMRIGGSADFLVRAATPEMIEAAMNWASDQDLPVTVIGGGSNLLVGDEGIRGLVVVVRTSGQKAESLLDVEDDGDAVTLRVGAQAPISWLGRYCAERGWAGMDWAVGLPGQVGGATVNNAGAHGTEIKDHLVAVEVLEDGVVREYDRTWLDPSFRMTRIKGEDRPRPWTVVRSVFRLSKGDRDALMALADEHATFRKTTQPTGACSGSVFVNPVGDFAGRLLEEAGLKGYSMGALQFSTKHANWIINTGGGTARDAWELIRHVRGIILDRYGIELRPEIERVGVHTDDETLAISDTRTGQDQ